MFTRNDKSIGVKNGVLGSVKEVGEDQMIVDLDEDDGTKHGISFNPHRYTAFDHGYAVKIHKSQGATVERSYVLASKTMDNPLTYVALTRHRQGARVYTNNQKRPSWMRRTTA